MPTSPISGNAAEFQPQGWIYGRGRCRGKWEISFCIEAVWEWGSGWSGRDKGGIQIPFGKEGMTDFWEGMMDFGRE